MKTAVVTGATKGIGRAVSEALWRDGYSLAVCARTEKNLMSMESEFGSGQSGQDFFWMVADLSETDQVAGFAEAIEERWEHIDVLVNNTGIFIPGEVLSEEEGTLDTMLRTNVYSAYDLTRRSFPLLRKSKGAHIFTMCSIASIKAYPNGGSYTIAKYALLGFTKVLREETKPLGMKVTAIIAGATWSDSWKGADFPQGRLMQANDIAEAVSSALRMGPSAVVEEILIRPQLGDV